MTSATDGAIISGLESALVVILAALVLGEAISRAGIVAVVACLAGLVVLTGGAAAARPSATSASSAACSAPASTAS
jgi:O-acetylserine/cysteine efflux transporter